MTDLRPALEQALRALRVARVSALHPDSVSLYNAAITRAEAALGEQEPVGWLESPHGAFRANLLYRMTAPQSVAWSIPLYTHPPRREWRGLTLLERAQIMSDVMANGKKGIDWLICAFEDALRRKNT